MGWHRHNLLLYKEKIVCHTYFLWHFKVEDYARWKFVFDEDPLDRESNGSKGGFVFRNANDPTEVMILLEWDEGKAVPEK